MKRYTGASPRVKAIVAQRSHGQCEKCGKVAASQLHHRRPRGMGGTRRASTNEASALLALCEPCHRFIETAARDLSRSNGWLVRQNSDPLIMPVLYRGRRAWLDDDGYVDYCAHLTRMTLYDNVYGDYEQCADCDHQFTTDGGPL